CRYRERFGGITEGARSVEHVSESLARRFNWQCFLLARRNRHVEVSRIGGNSLNWSRLSPAVTADQSHVRTIVISDDRNVGCLDLLITGSCHLERGGEVFPLLEPMQPARRGTPRPFRTDYTTSPRPPPAS